MKKSIILTLISLILISCDNHKISNNKESFDPTKNRANMNVDISLTYKIDQLSFSDNAKTYFLSGQRIYTVTNTNPVDILFNTNITRHSKLKDGKIIDSNMGKLPKQNTGKDLIIKSGESIVFEHPYNLNGKTDNPIITAIKNKNTNSLKWSESFLVLPPKDRDHAWSVVGTLFTKEATWDITNIKYKEI